MSVVNMIERQSRYGLKNEYGYVHTESILTTATGNDIRIPALPAGKNITCTLIAGASTGKFQITTSSDSVVTAGTATWQDWAQGNQTGTVSDAIISGVTAIRGVSVSGAIAIEIVI